MIEEEQIAWLSYQESSAKKNHSQYYNLKNQRKNMSDIDEKKPWDMSIHYACIRFLGKVLYRQGASSNDIVLSMATELVKIADELAEWTNGQLGDWKIVSRAIDYMGAIHDGPWRGYEWFQTTLQTLIELAAPNTGHDDLTGAFLFDIRHGVAASIQLIPVAKDDLRITNEVADVVKKLQEISCEYGLISDVLDLCEHIFHGDKLSPNQSHLLMISATAAPFARVERFARGMDHTE